MYMLIVFLLVGLIAGWMRSLVMKDFGSATIGDMVVGILGAFAGGFFFSMLGVSNSAFWESVGMSAVGATLFLFMIGLFSKSFGPHKPISRS